MTELGPTSLRLTDLGLPHAHLADELMLLALEAEPFREEPERDRLMTAATVQAALALADAVGAAADALRRADPSSSPELLLLDAARSRPRRRPGGGSRRATGG